jgi:hypothetical protein
MAEQRLPSDVIEAFQELGSLQRGDPEMAMLRIQHIMGGGVLNPVVEHVGDITHRMSHAVGYNSVQGYDKIVKTYKWLTNAYGFEREMEQNITNNAKYRKVPREKLVKDLHAALYDYAKEHAKLPVYNKAQWLARQAAIFLGLEKFKSASDALRLLLNMCPNQETFAQKAMEYSRNSDGTIKQFSTKG